MNENCNLNLAKYVWSVLRGQPIIIMSWGVNPSTVKAIDNGLEFHVQGFKHQGLVRVSLNEVEDLFVVQLISEQGEIKDTIQSIHIDNLVSIIDGAVEKTDDYENRISQEYGIITGTAKSETNTSQPAT